MTGTSTSPETTDGNAPSMPAATTTASTPPSRIARSGSSRRCSPATPTSSKRKTRQPISRATNAASSAAGASEAPAVSSPTTPPVSCGACASRRVTSTVLPLGAWTTCSNSAASRAATSALVRLTRTRPLGWRANSCWTAARTSGAALPAAYTISGTPLRCWRCGSTCTGAAPSTAASPAKGSRSATDDRQRDDALVEPSRAVATRIDLDRWETDGPQGVLDARPERLGSHPRQLVGSNLHPRAVREMAHPHLAEAELAQRLLCEPDPLQLLGRYTIAIWHPRRQARQRGLVPVRQSQLPRSGTDIGFAD